MTELVVQLASAHEEPFGTVLHALAEAQFFIRRLPPGVAWALRLDEDNSPAYRGSLDVVAHSPKDFWLAAVAIQKMPAVIEDVRRWDGALEINLYPEIDGGEQPDVPSL